MKVGGQNFGRVYHNQMHIILTIVNIINEVTFKSFGDKNNWKAFHFTLVIMNKRKSIPSNFKVLFLATFNL